jgi:hypothetical protein
MRRGVVNTFIMRLLRTTTTVLAALANISFLLSFLELLKSHLRDVIYHYDGDIDEIGIWRWKEVTGHRRTSRQAQKQTSI